jgi:chromosome segregation ATPase
VKIWYWDPNKRLKVAGLEEELSINSKTCDRLQTKLDATIIAHELRTTEVTNMIEKLKKDHFDALEDLSTSKSQIENFISENEDLKSRLEDSHIHTTKLEGTLVSFNPQIQQLKALQEENFTLKNNELSQTVSIDLKREVQGCNIKIYELQNALESSELEKTTLRMKLV